MFIICKNDFPWSACPDGTDLELATRIAAEFQGERGMQIGLAHKEFFHVQYVPVISAKLIIELKLKQETEDGN